jgi:hypothetical protein
MPAGKLPVSFEENTLMLKLARELATDMQPIERIQENLGIDNTQLARFKAHPEFLRYLHDAMSEWNSAASTPDRVKLKSMHFIEEALPEFFARAHDPREPLAAKTKLLETIGRFAGMGGTADGVVSGEKLSVIINLGGDQSLRVEKTMAPQRGTIVDAEVVTEELDEL